MGLDLSALAAVDQQGYALLRPEIAATLPYAAIFTESHNPKIVSQFAPQTLAYRRGIRTMAALLDCEATEAAIASQRSAIGWDALAAQCFAAAGLDSVALDNSVLADATLPLSWHCGIVQTHRLLPLETLAEAILPQSRQFDSFIEWFRSELDPPPDDVVGFKSAVAYRGGLDIRPVEYEEARLSFDETCRATEAAKDGDRGPVYINSPLAQFLLLHALEIAAKYALPVQIHTGMGGATLDLRLANPLHLRPLLEAPLYRQVPIILLNTAYPYLREAGYLAATYPQVYIDYGHIAALQSASGAIQALHQLLELAPTSKLLYGSGARFLPDAFYLAAAATRQTISYVLEEAVTHRDLTAQDAEAIAIAILQGNARQLYQLT